MIIECVDLISVYDQVFIHLPIIVLRQVVKQTVMTIVYGVTAYGARGQIQRQLKDKEGLTDMQKKIASKYLANAVFASLEKMFSKTREIQVCEN